MGNVLLSYELNSGNSVVVKVKHKSFCQGIISIGKYSGDGDYTLYKWFDEGRFPKEFDTCSQIVDGVEGNRLITIGVDDI